MLDRGQTSVDLEVREVSDALALALALVGLAVNSHGVRLRGEGSGWASASSCWSCLAGPVRGSVTEIALRIWLGRCSSSPGRLEATRPRTGQPWQRAFQFGDLIRTVVGHFPSHLLDGAGRGGAGLFCGLLWYSRCSVARGMSATVSEKARSNTGLLMSRGGV
jgi:hypothetical protein